MTFPTLGVAGLPDSGVATLAVNVVVINPAASGWVSDYAAGSSDPGISTVSFQAEQTASQLDFVSVSADGGMTVTNHGTGAADVVVSVEGYFTDDTTFHTGNTYNALSWPLLADTSSGTGLPTADPIPAHGQITAQVTGVGGIPSTGVNVVAVNVKASGSSGAGYLTAFAAGSSDPGISLLDYRANETDEGMVLVPVSSTGQITLVNHGSQPVDAAVHGRGYYLDPASQRIAATFHGTATSNIDVTQVAAGAQETFQAVGVAGIPTSGVSSVVVNVVALRPEATGYLSIFRGGGADTYVPAVSFQGGDNGDNVLDTTIASQVSPTGQISIVNHSAGSVGVRVSGRGYFAAAAAPSAPIDLSAEDVDDSGASVITWAAPATDGANPITAYHVAVNPGGHEADVTDGSDTATMTGLDATTTYTVTVTATNAVGTGSAASYQLIPADSKPTPTSTPSPPPDPDPVPPDTADGPATIHGKFLLANAQPAAGFTVEISAIPPAGPPWQALQSVPLGTAVTGTDGTWSYTLPTLDSTLQSWADSNGGVLNTEAVISAIATINGHTAAEDAAEDIPAGISSGDAATSGSIMARAESAPTMALVPTNDDVQAPPSGPQYDADYATDMNPPTADAPDGLTWESATGDTTPYNPNVLNATDYTNATTTDNADPTDCWTYFVRKAYKSTHRWVTVGEGHAYWNAYATFAFNITASNDVQVGYSADFGKHFSIAGTNHIGNKFGIEVGTWKQGPHWGHQFRVSFKFVYYHVYEDRCGSYQHVADEVRATNVGVPPGGSYGEVGKDVSYADGAQGYFSSPKRYRLAIKHNTYLSITQGKSLQYHNAFSAFGFSAGQTTAYSTSRKQQIFAGSSTAYEHDIWGNDNDPVHAQVFYSY